MNNPKKIKESAAVGSVSAGSIAVRTDTTSRGEKRPMKKRDLGFLNFMQKNNRKIANGLNMKEIKTPFPVSKLKENVSLDQIYSKLSGVQNQSRMQEDNTQTYGVEDDNGNLMKITVRGDQQEEFESALAEELAEVEEYKMTGRSGHGGNVSMAEVLYNLKQNFDIVNVEFPEIPKDKVYNADKVSDPEDVNTGDEFQNNGLEDSDGGDLDNEQGFEDENGEPGEGSEDLDDVDFGDEEGSPDEEEDMGVEFGEEEEEESMLKKIISMLSSEAEARRAQYEAEAEKSRALQAKYSMKAAQEEMDNQEELARMENEMKAQKDKEKEAKKLADLAKFKMRGNVTESKTSFGDFLTGLFEEENPGDSSDTEIGSGYDAASLRRQRREVSTIQDPQERVLKQRELNAKIRIAQNKERENRKSPEETRDSNNRGRNPNSNNTGSPNRRSGGMMP